MRVWWMRFRPCFGLGWGRKYESVRVFLKVCGGRQAEDNEKRDMGRYVIDVQRSVCKLNKES